MFMSYIEELGKQIRVHSCRKLPEIKYGKLLSTFVATEAMTALLVSSTILSLK